MEIENNNHNKYWYLSRIYEGSNFSAIPPPSISYALCLNLTLYLSLLIFNISTRFFPKDVKPMSRQCKY